MILSQALNQAAAKNMGHPALNDLGKILTYGELKKRVSQLSYLYQTEIEAGQRVAILATNGSSVVVTFFAMTNIGSPVLFLDPADSNESFVNDLIKLEIKYLLITGDQLSRARDFQRSSGLPLTIIELEKKRGGEYDTSFTPAPERPLNEKDIALILRKDDFGHDRKYIFFNHKKVYQSVNAVKRFYRLTPNDRMMSQMNWSHPFSLTHGMLLPLFMGATCVVDPLSPSVEEFIEFLAKERVTRFAGPPKYYFQLLTYCASQKYTLPGVKSITVGMGSISLALRKTYRLLNIPVLRCYGRHEAVWSIAMDSFEEAADIENAKSRPITGVKCKVIDANGDEIPGPGRREGLLCVTSEFVMDGYFHPNKEQAAAATRFALRGTWFYTQEIARLEGEGDQVTVAVLGKVADMLPASRGFGFVSPREMDDHARSIPGVQDAAGFVRENEDGERFFACAVIPERKNLSQATVLAELQKKLPQDYPLRSVHFTDSIPLESFGSVNRQALTRQFP
ncbi:MAG: class I adenylate-forming enzyme family protein [Bdellovibrionota bacterium]